MAEQATGVAILLPRAHTLFLTRLRQKPKIETGKPVYLFCLGADKPGCSTGGFMFGGKIGLPELAVIVFIALLIFGPKKLGELGKGLGEGIRNF